MKKTIATILAAAACTSALAGNLYVQVYKLTSLPVSNRRVTLTLVEPGPLLSGPWLVAGDSVAQFTASDGTTTFTNVLAAQYRLDIAGTPSRSFPVGMPDTNGTINAFDIIGSTNSVPVFLTAAQIAMFQQVVTPSNNIAMSTNAGVVAVALASNVTVAGTLTSKMTSIPTVTDPVFHWQIDSTNVNGTFRVENDSGDGGFISLTSDGELFANSFSGTFFGDGSGLTGDGSGWNNIQHLGQNIGTYTGSGVTWTLSTTGPNATNTLSFVPANGKMEFSGTIIADTNVVSLRGQFIGNGGGLTNVHTTNAVLADATAKQTLLITNGAALGFTDDNTNDIVLLLPRAIGGDRTVRLVVQGTNAFGTPAQAELRFIMNHGSGTPELFLQSDGKMAFGVGQGNVVSLPFGQPRDYQWGIAAFPNTYHHETENQIPVRGSSSNLYASLPHIFDASYRSNGVRYGVGSGLPISGQGETSPNPAPGYWVEAYTNSGVTTVGAGAFTIFDQLPLAVSDNTNFDAGMQRRVMFRLANVTAGGGLDLAGTVNYSVATAAAASSTALDFGNSQIMDYTASGNTVALTTANDYGNFYMSTVKGGERLFIVRAGGFAPSITAPAGWTGWTATNLTAAQYLILRMASMGLGETNKIVLSEQVATDPTFGYDQDVQNFMFRSGLTDLTTSNALNNFVKTLKADGTWTNFQAIYPFVGTTSNTCSWNLANTNAYRMAWASSGVTYSGGITGDGVNGFGNTGWSNTAVNAGCYFAWLKGYDAVNDFATFLGGQQTGSPFSGMIGDSHFTGGWFACDINAGNNPGANISGVTGAYTNGFAATRTSSTTLAQFHNFALLASPSSSSPSLSSVPVYVLGKNFGGLNSPWNKTIQVAMFGSNTLSLANYQTAYSASTNFNAAESRN